MGYLKYEPHDSRNPTSISSSSLKVLMVGAQESGILWRHPIWFKQYTYWLESFTPKTRSKSHQLEVCEVPYPQKNFLLVGFSNLLSWGFSMKISIQKLGGTATQTRCHQEGGLRRAPGHSYSHPSLAVFAGQTYLAAFRARRLQGAFSLSPACRIWAAKNIYIYVYICV